MVNQQLESGHLDDGPVMGDCLATTAAIPLGCICEQVGNTQAEDMLWLQLVLPGKKYFEWLYHILYFILMSYFYTEQLAMIIFKPCAQHLKLPGKKDTVSLNLF